MSTGSHDMDDEFVLLDSFPTPHEAHLAANALRAVEIPVKIVDEATVGLMPHLESALGGVKLFVRESDVEDAARILRGDADLADQPYREAAPDDSLTGLPEDDPETVQQEAAGEEACSRAFRASIIGLFLCPVLLHIYSAILLLQIARTGERLSPKSTGRVRIAWGVNAIVILLALIGLVRYVGVW